MRNTITVNGTTVRISEGNIPPPKTPSWRVADVARYFGVNPSTVYKWVYQNLIPCHRTPGRGLRFVEAEVKAAQVKKEAT